MFILFALAFVIPYAATELPSYIHPCGRKEPNYESCIMKNIINIKDKICTGIPELNVPPKEPFLIDKLVIYDTANIKMFLQDGRIYKFCDFSVNSIQADPDKLHFDFNFIMKHLEVDMMYDFNMHLLMNIFNKGKIYFTADNVGVRHTLDLKETIKNGKKRIYVSKMNFNLDIKNVTYKFDESKKELALFYEISRDIIDKDLDNIINVKFKPALEGIFLKELITIYNDVFYKYSEELFPERSKTNLTTLEH